MPLDAGQLQRGAAVIVCRVGGAALLQHLAQLGLVALAGGPQELGDALQLLHITAQRSRVQRSAVGAGPQQLLSNALPVWPRVWPAPAHLALDVLLRHRPDPQQVGDHLLLPRGPVCTQGAG